MFEDEDAQCRCNESVFSVFFIKDEPDPNNDLHCAIAIAVAIAIVLGTAGVTGCAGPKIPVGMDANNPIQVCQILDVYRQLTGKTIEAAPDVRNDQTLILLHQTRPVTRAQACRLIERDLREQAGIIILRQDHKHIVFGFRANAKRF
jgi:hypothetical protein